MINSSLKKTVDLNDLVHLISYFITQKIINNQYVRVNFSL